MLSSIFRPTDRSPVSRMDLALSRVAYSPHFSPFTAAWNAIRSQCFLPASKNQIRVSPRAPNTYWFSISKFRLYVFFPSAFFQCRLFAMLNKSHFMTLIFFFVLLFFRYLEKQINVAMKFYISTRTCSSCKAILERNIFVRKSTKENVSNLDGKIGNGFNADFCHRT